MRDIFARILFGVTGVLAAVGVTLSATLETLNNPNTIIEFGGGHGDPASFSNWFWRMTITFFYFTILSNIVVGVTTLLLAIKLDRTSTVFRAFRIFGLIAIIITFLVVNLYLNRFYTPTGWHLVLNDIVHVSVPILATLGWLVFGPRIPFRMKYVWWALSIGVAWLVVTFAHGAIIRWYPYPFLDVDRIGVVKSLVNSAGILVIGFGMAVGILALDKVLPGPKEHTAAPAAAGTAP